MILPILLLVVIVIIIRLCDFVLKTEVSPRSTRITRKRMGNFNAEGGRGRRRREDLFFSYSANSAAPAVALGYGGQAARE